MLTKGDLVKVRQDSFMYPVTLEPWLVSKLKHPKYGVVVKKLEDDQTEVFVEDQRWVVNDKCLQLIGGTSVHKTK